MSLLKLFVKTQEPCIGNELRGSDQIIKLFKKIEEV